MARAAVRATVTVQELTFTLLLLAAGPVVLHHRETLGVDVAALVGMAVIVAILGVSPRSPFSAASSRRRWRCWRCWRRSLPRGHAGASPG
jgi:hypothetical protein